MDRSHGRVQIHEKIIQALTLSGLPDNTYDDDNNGGPLKPGFHFYKWMMLGPPLQLPIAETYLCHRRGGVTCLRTDPTTVIDRCDCSTTVCCSHVVKRRHKLICFLILILKEFLHIPFFSIHLPPPGLLSYSRPDISITLCTISFPLAPSLLQGYIIKHTHPLNPEGQLSDIHNRTATSSDLVNDR